MASGAAAARAIVESADRAFGRYKELLSSDFVLKDHRRLRHAPDLIFSSFVQHVQTGVVCDVVEEMFTVTNPAPKRGLIRIVRGAMRRRGVSMRDAVKTGWRALRVFG